MKKNLIAVVIVMASLESFSQNSDSTKTSPGPTITKQIQHRL